MPTPSSVPTRAPGGYMLAAGLCSDGQLGLGSEELQLSFQPVTDVASRSRRHRRLPPSALQGQGVASVSCGWAHSFAIMAGGEPVACGYNGHGQLGLGHSEAQVSFVSVASLGGRDVAAVSCGGYHSVAVTRAGKVFAAGLNEDGQLGVGGTADQSVFQPVTLGGEAIAAAAAGWSHTCLLARDGGLLVAGRNAEGQLGLGHTEARSSFARVDTSGFSSDDPITAVACGGRFTCVLTKSGALYSTGLNEDGQLGLGDTDNRCHFQRVESLSDYRIASVSCGAHHVFVMTTSGQALGCGLNDDGQLGLGHRSDQWDFAVASGLGGWGVTKVVCGGSHTCAVTESQEVLVAGQNLAGQLGLGHDDSQTSFSPVAGLAGRGVALVSCGGAHTLALTDAGQDQPPGAKDDPPEADFELYPEAWKPVAATQREARAVRAERHELWWAHGASCIAGDDSVMRTHLRAKYHASHAAVNRICQLPAEEQTERRSIATYERASRSTVLSAHRWALQCGRRLEEAASAETSGRRVAAQEEAAGWRLLTMLEYWERRTVYQQTEHRRQVAAAEVHQCEWHHRAMIRAEQAIMHRRQAVLHADLQRRLAAMLELAREVRRTRAVPPAPPAILHLVSPAESWADDFGAVAAASLDGSAAEAHRALRALDRLAAAVTEGDLAAAGRRDEARCAAQEKAAVWFRGTDAPVLRGLLGRWREVVQWTGQLGDALGELAAAAEEAASAGSRTGGSPTTYSLAPTTTSDGHDELQVFPPVCVRSLPCGRQGSQSDGTDAFTAAMPFVKAAIAAVARWQQEYLDACAAAELRTNRAKAEIWRFLTVLQGTHLPRWDWMFDELQKAVVAEQKVKALTRGVSRVPERECREAAERLYSALALLNDQVWTLDAERWEAAAVVGRLTDEAAAVEAARRRLSRLRSLVGKGGAGAKLAALKAALEAGALPADVFEMQSQRLAEVAEAEAADADKPSLWDRRESVRKRRFELEHAQEQLRLQPPPDGADARVSIKLGELADARRRLHAELAIVAADCAALWAACESVAPEVEAELRRLVGSPLIDDIPAPALGARGLVVDRKRAEYDYEGRHQDPDAVTGPGKHRILWASFNGRRTVLKEYRLHVRGASLVVARRHFARGLQDYAVTAHPAIAPVAAAFMQTDDSGCAAYLQLPFASANLGDWAQQHRGSDDCTAVTVMAALAVAVEFMHQSRDWRPTGVLHSDIKTTNVLLDGVWPMLADMDLELDVDCDRGATRRTYDIWDDSKPSWVPPELCIPGTAVRNDAPPTAAADVYALGRVFQQLLRHPVAQGIAQIEALVRTVDAMVSPDPSARPAADALAQQMVALRAVVLADRRAAAGAGAAEGEKTVLADDPALVAAKRLWVESDAAAQRGAELRLRGSSDRPPAEEEVDAAAAAVAKVRRELCVSELRAPAYWTAQATPGGRHFDAVPLSAASNRPAVVAVTEIAAAASAGAVNVRHIWRIENHWLWRRYAAVRQATRRDRRAGVCVPTDLHIRSAVAAAVRGLPGLLDGDAQERYLVCGLRSDNVLRVISDGPLRLTAGYSGAWLGSGVYLTDDVSRADAFTTTDAGEGQQPALHQRLFSGGLQHPGVCRYFALCRVVLGNVMFTADGGRQQTKQGGRATDRECWQSPGRTELARAGKGSPRLDALVAEIPGAAMDVVCSDPARVLPEYLVAYTP